jgi:hypothetical protein
MTTQMRHTNGATWCVARPGFAPGQFVHPEGECACFRGGPAPVLALTDRDRVLAAAAAGLRRSSLMLAS